MITSQPKYLVYEKEGAPGNKTTPAPSRLPIVRPNLSFFDMNSSEYRVQENAMKSKLDFYTDSSQTLDDEPNNSLAEFFNDIHVKQSFD